jgi:undecaprenyl-diphosphatase
MWLVSRSGDLGMIWLCISALLLFWPATRIVGGICVATLLATTCLGEFLLKQIFRRPRPYVTYGPVKLTIPMPSGFSFPSGHTASAMAAARVLATLGPWMAAAAYFYAVLMGLSRIYLKAHYVTDVVAGGAMGFICGGIIRKILL